MSKSWFGSVASLSPAQARQIEVVCNRFEAAWQTSDPPRIDDFLEGWTGAERFALQRELIALDSEYRGRNGLFGEPTAALPHKVEDANDFPSQPGVAREAIVDVPPREGPGCRIGSYQLVEQIGEGGMGTVFLAEQQQPVRRQVALKVIKPGMDSRQVIARFEAERQALALMNHPNIAAVFDAGTTPSGHPYFVMELVHGLPITQYCDEHCLTPKQRLELFMSVCQAVQHAHQKGIIHRDLKPSNVLAALCDGKVVTKVIDFGLAKATGAKLMDQTLSTDVGTMVGTWQYMAPEQTALNQLDVDTRADIYALGVLLYELLTGSTPLELPRVRQTAMLELLRLIRDEEPPKPSTRLSRTAELPRIAAQRGMSPKKLSSMVRGDLDWIVMKCLEKDRDRRYQTAEELAADVQRYLTHEPVLARPPSVVYRLHKFARRHQTGLAAAMVIGIVVLLAGGGAGWTLWERAAQSAQQQIVQSKREAETERAVTVALDKAEHWEAQAKRLPCTTSSNAQVVLAAWKDAVAALEKAEAALATGTATEPLRERVQAVSQRIIEGQTRTRRQAKLFGDLDEARMSFPVRLLGSRFDYTGAATKYAAAFAAYDLDVAGGDMEELARRLREEEPEIRETLILALDNWASYAPSAQTARSATELRALAQAADSDAWRRRFRIANAAKDGAALHDLSIEARQSSLPPTSLFLLAASLNFRGQRDEALALLRWGRAQYPTDFWIHCRLAEFLSIPKAKTPLEVEEALGCFLAALALRPETSVVHYNFGNLLANEKRWDEAIFEYQKAIEFGIGAEHHIKPAHYNLGRALYAKKQWDKATVEFRKAIAIEFNYAPAHVNLGSALHAMNQLDDAIDEYKLAIRIDGTHRVAHYNLGNALRDKEQWDEAIAEYQEAIKVDPSYAEAYCNLGFVLQRQGRFTESLVYYREGDKWGRKRADWHDRSAQWVADAERQVELLDRKLSAIQKCTEETPAGVAERLDLAELCQKPVKKLFAASAGFYAAAFEKPELTKNPRNGHRYRAACVATSAGCGQGNDADKLDEKERARLRRQALDWLMADLALWAERADSKNAKERDAVQQQMKQWQSNADLAGVRDQTELAKLPDTEREAWEKLWADVDALRMRAAERKVTYLDLQPQANWKLKDGERNNLAALPTGEQAFADVKFKVADGMILLGGPTLRDMPEKVEGIKVGTTCSKLHFLHACHGNASPGTITGYYTINYEDKSQEKIALVFGQDIANWWYGPNEGAPSRAAVAWKGTNDKAKSEGANIRLYMMTWNTEPERKVVSIDFGCQSRAGTNPFCVAITAEK
jgi:serine/threonine protein kinase/tetratricopeptide (TPR) repeat protein